MDLVDAQPEFTKAFWDYLDILVNDAPHCERPRHPRQAQGSSSTRSEAVRPSTRFIITAIWGVESNLRPRSGDRPVLRSTATLACVGRRQAYFATNFSRHWKSCIAAT